MLLCYHKTDHHQQATQQYLAGHVFSLQVNMQQCLQHSVCMYPACAVCILVQDCMTVCIQLAIQCLHNCVTLLLVCSISLLLSGNQLPLSAMTDHHPSCWPSSGNTMVCLARPVLCIKASLCPCAYPVLSWDFSPVDCGCKADRQRKAAVQVWQTTYHKATTLWCSVLIFRQLA